MKLGRGHIFHQYVSSSAGLILADKHTSLDPNDEALVSAVLVHFHGEVTLGENFHSRPFWTSSGVYLNVIGELSEEFLGDHTRVAQEVLEKVK